MPLAYELNRYSRQDSDSKMCQTGLVDNVRLF